MPAWRQVCGMQFNKPFQIYSSINSSYSLYTVIPRSAMNNTHLAEHIKITDGAAEEFTLNEMSAIG